MHKFMKPSFEKLIESIKSWENFEEIHKKLNGNLDHFLEHSNKTLKTPTKFAVLNHGDFHAKNMMYRNEGLKDEDIILVICQLFFLSKEQLS